MQIGKALLKHGIILAPMAGVTDRAYRNVCKKHGAEFVISEMVSAKAMHYKDANTKFLSQITENEQPMAIQLFGSEPDIIAEAAKQLSEMEERPAAIDINMGCPVKKIVSNREGSALMREPERAAEIVYAASKAVDIPITVKMRAGFSSNELNAPSLAKMCEQAGASLITVHGRTRDQFYAPPVDHEIIKKVKEAVSIPVIGNGSIYTADDAIHMLNSTGCDGIMIARGSMGNPWLFDEIICRLENRSFSHPSREEIIAQAIAHAEMMIAYKGHTGILEARRHLAYYIKGFSGAAAARGMLNSASTFDEMKRIMFDLLKSEDHTAEQIFDNKSQNDNSI